MEIVANEYLSYGEEQHSVDKLVNMTCKCCHGDMATFPTCLNEQDGVFNRRKDTVNACECTHPQLWDQEESMLIAIFSGKIYPEGKQ